MDALNAQVNPIGKPLKSKQVCALTETELVNLINQQINKSKSLDESNISLREVSRVNIKNSIKRDYKLTGKVSFDVFNNFLSSELRVMNLLNTIDQNARPPTDSDELTLEEHRHAARDVIINRLDATYQSKCMHIKSPIELLNKLKEIKINEANVSTMTVRQELYAMRFIPKRDKSCLFWDRFEALIRKHDNLPDAIPMSDSEKRDIFYHAIFGF